MPSITKTRVSRHPYTANYFPGPDDVLTHHDDRRGHHPRVNPEFGKADAILSLVDGLRDRLLGEPKGWR